MCPSGWGSPFSQKSIFHNDCEKLFKTKHLAKHIKSSSILLQALTSISTLSKRCQLVERVSEQMGTAIFADQEEKRTHALNTFLCEQLKLVADAHAADAPTHATILFNVIDREQLLQSIDNQYLKKLLLAPYWALLTGSMTAKEQQALCQRLVSAIDVDDVFRDALLEKEGVAHNLLMANLSAKDMQEANKALLLMGLLRTKSGASFFFEYRQELLKQLNSAVIAHQNDDGESVLLYLIAKYWMYLPFANQNLFACLDTDIVYRQATAGPNLQQSIASQLTSCGHRLAISLVLMHDAVLLSQLKPETVKAILLACGTQAELLCHLASAMTSVSAFKRIETCLFDVHQMHLLSHDETQEAIAKLYLQMEQSDVVLSKEDRICLMQYMKAAALNYKDSQHKTPVTYLVKYKEGLQRFEEDAEFRGSVSSETMSLLDEEDREVLASFNEQIALKSI